MKNLSKSKWRGQNGKFTKCNNCGKGFTVIAFNKHRLICGLEVATENMSIATTLHKTKKNSSKFRGSINQAHPSKGKKRSEVIAELKRGKLNGPYTKEDEKELNRIIGSRNAGFVRK
jgi:ribosomal protein S27AE